jgi:hypothetical protein
VIPRLKPYFLSLTPEEAQYVWSRYINSRGLPASPFPWDVESMWTELNNAGVFQSELVAPLLTDPEAKYIVQKLLGAEV